MSYSYKPEIMFRLNCLGIARITKFKYVVPIEPQFIGIICGIKCSNIQKIETKFNVSIIFKKVSSNNKFKYPGFIINCHSNIEKGSDIEQPNHVEERIWKTIHYIQNIVKYAKTNPIDINTKNIRGNLMSMPFTDHYNILKNRIQKKTWINPEYILKLNGHDPEKNTNKFKEYIMTGFIPVSSLFDNNPMSYWIEYYHKTKQSKRAQYTKLLEDTRCSSCYCSDPNDSVTFEECRICLEFMWVISFESELKTNKNSRYYYIDKIEKSFN